MKQHPRLIQGGMGIGVSGWQLARTVSMAGQLGTVSGTGIWLVMTRELQLGDRGGHIRRALSWFPAPDVAERIIAKYFIPGGKPENRPFKNPPMLTHPLRRDLAELLVASNFVEVWLAKEGHDGLVAINFLEKIQLAHLPSLYGAMLAGVDYVLMGAGIPIQIAEALDSLSKHEPARYRLQVEESSDDSYESHFSPAKIPIAGLREPLARPYFFPIISSNVLAQVLLKRSKGKIDGFIVEGHTAGGHNAPPRNRKDQTPGDEPAYGEQDAVDLAKMRGIGLPFYLAGSYVHPDDLRHAIAEGAQGIQVGSIFALSRESGLRSDLKQQVIENALQSELRIQTNASCSPSGYPFKEAMVAGTLADPSVAARRRTICDIGSLRTVYRREDGKLGYRCAAEPLDQYVKKGGGVEDTAGKRCLCNTLCSTIGLGQVRPEWGYTEPPLVTLGSDLGFLPHLTTGDPYGAGDALKYLLGSSSSL